LDEERFVDVFNCFFGFANAYGQGAKPNRAATELLTQVGKHGAVDFVETKVIDAKDREAFVRSCFIDTAIATNLGEVANSAKETIGDTGCATGASGDLGSATVVDADSENATSARNDRLQFVGVVVIETGDQTEAVAQGTGDEARTRRGSDEGEPWQIEANRASGRTFAQHNVELEIFHCRIQHFFDVAAEAMDFVDEQDIAFAETGEDGREVSGSVECGTRGDMKTNLKFGGHDAGQSCFSKPWRTSE
jgi:hypothetical protein